MRSYFWDTLPGMRPPLPFQPVFEVLSGLHEGVVIPLEMRRYAIGASLPADIILHDVGVAPEHAALLIDRQNVRLEALGGEVDFQSGRLPPAHGCYLQLPVN